MKYNYNSTWNQLYLPPVGDTFPVGAVVDYSGTTAPHNWLICDGSAVSRTTYSALFSVIGTTYGTGDGSTTFNLPNFTGKVGVGYASGDTDFGTLGKTGGEKTHTLTVEELPSHEHTEYFVTNDGNRNPAVIGTAGSAIGTYAKLEDSYEVGRNPLVTGITGGNQPHNNLQPYIVQNKIIKAYNVSASPVIVGSIIDSLTSTSTTDALSANQGYVLNNKITNIYPVSLFTGSTTDTTFALSSSVTNYKRIKIFYRDNNGTELSSREVYNNKADFNTDLFLYEVNGSAVAIRACRATFSGTSVSIANKYYNGTWGTSYIYITKILGFLE